MWGHAKLSFKYFSLLMCFHLSWKLFLLSSILVLKRVGHTCAKYPNNNRRKLRCKAGHESSNFWLPTVKSAARARNPNFCAAEIQSRAALKIHVCGYNANLVAGPTKLWAGIWLRKEFWKVRSLTPIKWAMVLLRKEFWKGLCESIKEHFHWFLCLCNLHRVNHQILPGIMEHFLGDFRIQWKWWNCVLWRNLLWKIEIWLHFASILFLIFITELNICFISQLSNVSNMVITIACIFCSPVWTGWAS